MRMTKIITAAAISLLALSSAAYAAGDAKKGKIAFEKNGCWQCHGYQGQGGIAGPALQRTQLPYEALNTFVRETSGAMPPYTKKILSDGDLEDIYAFLQSIPAPADYKTIKLLNP
jgi:mono/diheme cytochrome c family protein